MESNVRSHKTIDYLYKNNRLNSTWTFIQLAREKSIMFRYKILFEINEVLTQFSILATFDE